MALYVADPCYVFYNLGRWPEAGSLPNHSFKYCPPDSFLKYSYIIPHPVFLMPAKTISSVLFDTSFLLKESPDIDTIIKILHKDGISCYISPTIKTELDDLYYVGRISEKQHKKATKRCMKSRVSSIESRRNYLQESMNEECMVSMNHEHGAAPKDVRNDCNILTSSLSHDIDMILAEDFHFTSKYTEKVVETVSGNICGRFGKLCDSEIVLLNKDTFLAAYREKQVDMDVVESMKQQVKKDSKVLGHRA